MELLKFLQVFLVQCQGLAAVGQSGNDNCLVGHEFGGLVEVFVVEDSVEVWEVVNLLEVGFISGDVEDFKRCFWSF